ncbi:MAG: class I SAM-dependent methyltransferase [Woeseiaceae bacterium]
MSETRQSHWHAVYRDKAPTDVSWYQPVPTRSIQLIQSTGVAKSDPIIDAGGGASTLVDHLLLDGYEDITVLDISGQALQRSQQRLGDAAIPVHWIEADVTAFRPPRRYAIWHDRAVFHFLVDAEERRAYVEVASKALMPAGYLLLATFGPEGPERCSGLPVQRYGIEALQALLEPLFILRDDKLDVHETPTGSMQQFLYSWWQFRR